MKKCDWLYIKQHQLLFSESFSFWNAPASTSLAISSSICILFSSMSSSSLSSGYSPSLLFCRISSCSSSVKHFFCHNYSYTSREELFHTQTPYTGHTIHKNFTTYLHWIKDSAKLSADNPQSCLLWQGDSRLLSRAVDRAGYFVAQNSFSTRETWRYCRVLET